MKDQLNNHFGNDLVFIKASGKSSIVTLKTTAATILHNFYCNSRQEDCDAEKRRIIKTAAKLIKSDTQAVSQMKNSYACCHELSSVEEAVSFLPESLLVMLNTLFTVKQEPVKLASLGQATMQATQPRSVLAPLQVGVGIQLHHHFASKFLINSMNKYEFCCSYSEVIKFERIAAVAQGRYSRFLIGTLCSVCDNVDHNI